MCLRTLHSCDGLLPSKFYGDRFPEGCLSPTNRTAPQLLLNVDSAERVSFLNRRLFRAQQAQPLQLSAVFAGDVAAWTQAYATSWSAMAKALPSNVDVLDLRYVHTHNSELVLQLWHMFEQGESAQYSRKESVRLDELFKTDVLRVANATELSLYANMPRADIERMHWNVRDAKGNVKRVGGRDKVAKADSLTVQMRPRQIRTFLLNA